MSKGGREKGGKEGEEGGWEKGGKEEEEGGWERGREGKREDGRGGKLNPGLVLAV